MILAVENTRKSHYYLDQLYSSIESPFLGLCYDSSHDFLSVSEPGEILRKWGHLLVATHLSDNDGISDKHWIPRKGAIDWEMVKECFPKDTYTGFLTLEVVPKTGEVGSARVFLKKAFESILWMESLLKEK